MSGRALVPVAIVGIIAIAIVLIVIINKFKRRDPVIKFQQAHVKLVHHANEVFNELLSSHSVDSTSFLTDDHKQLIADWKTNYRKVNG